MSHPRTPHHPPPPPPPPPPEVPVFTKGNFHHSIFVLPSCSGQYKNINRKDSQRHNCCRQQTGSSTMAKGSSQKQKQNNIQSAGTRIDTQNKTKQTTWTTKSFFYRIVIPLNYKLCCFFLKTKATDIYMANFLLINLIICNKGQLLKPRLAWTSDCLRTDRDNRYLLCLTIYFSEM